MSATLNNVTFADLQTSRGNGGRAVRHQRVDEAKVPLVWMEQSMELKTHRPCMARKSGIQIGRNEKGVFQSDWQRRWATDQRPPSTQQGQFDVTPQQHSRNNAKYLVSTTKCTYFVTLSYLMHPGKESSVWKVRTEQYKAVITCQTKCWQKMLGNTAPLQSRIFQSNSRKTKN
jgi:hypothetical protein